MEEDLEIKKILSNSFEFEGKVDEFQEVEV